MYNIQALYYTTEHLVVTRISLLLSQLYIQSAKPQDDWSPCNHSSGYIIQHNIIKSNHKSIQSVQASNPNFQSNNGDRWDGKIIEMDRREKRASSLIPFILFLTFQLMMNDIGEVGLFTPPEDPQLLGVGLDLAPPHAQQVGLHAAHEAAQDRVVLGRGRDHRPVLPAAAEAVATPFNARQLRLGEEERE